MVGDRVADVPWPGDTTLVAILRSGHVHAPLPDVALERLRPTQP